LIESLFIAHAYRSYLLSVLILVAGCSHIFASLSGVAWLSWMSSLVPEEIRGRYFGLRNSVLGIITISLTILGGYFLDWSRKHFPAIPPTRSFEALFIVAISAGLVSLFFLRRQADISAPAPGPSSNLSRLFTEPLRQDNFKRFIRFALFWAFAVNFSSPFFIIYMLTDLKLNYTMISIYTVCSAIADFIGMGIWGHISDRFGNRSIIIVTSLLVTVLPAIWLFTNASVFSIYVLIPLLHLSGGFFWAAYNLCAGNLVFRMAPREQNSAFFAFWSISSANGAAAGLGAIMGGILSQYTPALLAYFPAPFDSGFKIIFFVSFLLRFGALFLVRGIREDMGMPVRKFVEVLRSVKLWTTMMGNHPIFQFFLPASDSESSTPFWPLWRLKAANSKK
jgi:MFS family permease